MAHARTRLWRSRIAVVNKICPLFLEGEPGDRRRDGWAIE